MRNRPARKSIILIYRPDKAPHPAVRPDLCYTLNGENFIDWQRKQSKLAEYEEELAKREYFPDYQILDYWR